MTSVGAGTTLTLTGNNTYTGATTVNSGRLVVEGSITSSLTLENGAMLDGNGTVGPVIIRDGGVVAPGNSPGLLTVGDTLIEGGGAYLLDLRSDGTGAAGTEWDSLAVNGTLDTTALTEANPFILRLQTLDPDNSLNYLEVWDRNVSHTWSSVLTAVAVLGGDFDPRVIEVDATGFQNPVNGTFTVVQEGTNLNLQYDAAPSTLSGDYNQNGTVDAADYVVWRKGLGTTYTQNHYDIWRANFGATAGSGATAGLPSSANVAVPEPATWVMMLGALCLVAWRTVGRRRTCVTAPAFRLMPGPPPRALLLAALAIFSPILGSIASALDTTWMNAGLGDWSIVSNWSGGVPAYTDDAYIPQGLALVSSIGAVAKIIEVSDGGSLLVAAHSSLVSSTGSYIGAGVSGLNASATVSGASSYWDTGIAAIGWGGRGTLRVENGGRVQSDTLYLASFFDGTHGSATVTGAESIWLTVGKMFIGTRGTGSLTISNGGAVVGAPLLGAPLTSSTSTSAKVPVPPAR